MFDRIAKFADIDTRRALSDATGITFRPQKLTLPDIKIPTSRIFSKGNISIKVSPWRLWTYFTVVTEIEGTNYTAESEYCFETGRVVTRVSGGLTNFRLYQIVEFPTVWDEFPNEHLWKIHREFERLRIEGED
jgi:hypothetical protein